eukprot:COSAG05_NODE_686_length_7932_cov_3.338823_6_plen_80_part_00
MFHAHPLLVRTRMGSVAVAIGGPLPNYWMKMVSWVVATADGRNTQATAILRQQEHAISRGIVPRLFCPADTRLHSKPEP